MSELEVLFRLRYGKMDLSVGGGGGGVATSNFATNRSMETVTRTEHYFMVGFMDVIGYSRPQINWMKKWNEEHLRPLQPKGHHLIRRRVLFPMKQNSLVGNRRTVSGRPMTLMICNFVATSVLLQEYSSDLKCHLLAIILIIFTIRILPEFESSDEAAEFVSNTISPIHIHSVMDLNITSGQCSRTHREAIARASRAV